VNGELLMPVIETKNLSKRYANGVEGIIDLDITVQEGEIFGFLGPNGSGKTTTVRLLNGTLSASEGTAYIFGEPCKGEKVRMRTATLAEEALMYEHLSVVDNLRFFAALYDIDRGDADQRIGTLMKRMGLEGREHDKLATFSTGMKKRVYLARTLLHRPALIFLDEPSSGLDPEASLKVTTLIQQLASEEGTTIFLCTHNLALAERICDSIGLLENGRLLGAGSAQELKQSVFKKQELTIRTLSGTLSRSFSHEREINGILRSVMEEGKSIVEAEIKKPSLEDVYFHYVGKDEKSRNSG
jgi:ABC-2 type transport system ATP-binding protein